MSEYWDQTPIQVPAIPPAEAYDYDVPHYANGIDDPGYAAALLIRHAEDAARDDTVPDPAPPAPRRASLWTITEGWKASAIPRRPWVARGYLMRGSVTVISGPASAGKSSLMVAWASTMALGSAFRALRVKEPVRTALYNVEDDADEQCRRFSAMAQRLQIESDKIMERVTIIGPTTSGALLQVTRDGLMINTAAMDEFDQFLTDHPQDVAIFDPFVELHGAEENDNTAIRAVMAFFRQLAARHRIAVVILHHNRKGIGEPGDPDTIRGASSIVGAARVVFTMSVMTPDDAKAMGISEERRRNYFRLDGAKSNYAPLDEAEWFERQEMRLPNGSDDEPGDGVAIAWPWTPPSAFAETTPVGINGALDKITEGPPDGGKYGTTRRGKSGRWVGSVLVRELGVTEQQAERMVAAWLKSGLLFQQDYYNQKWRRDERGAFVDDAKRPT